MEDNKPYVTVKEAEKITGMAEYRIRQMISSGEIAFIQCGKKYMIFTPILFQVLKKHALSNIKNGDGIFCGGITTT